MYLFTKVMGQWPIKRRDDDNNNGLLYKVIPAYEYHFYTVSTFRRSNPQVRVMVIIVYVHVSYSSFSPYGKCDSDQSSFHHKSQEQYM